MLVQTARRQVSHRGFARVMAVERPTLADGPRWDPLCRPASVYPRSLAGIQQGTARPDWDRLPFLPRVHELGRNQAPVEFDCWKPAGFHPCQPMMRMRYPDRSVKICWQGLASLRSVRGDR